MANIQEDVTKQVWELFLRFFGTGSEFIYQVAHEGNVALKQGGNFTKEFLLALINKQKENNQSIDAAAQMLKRAENGEGVNTMSVADEDAAELAKIFEEKGLLYKVIENSNDDTKIFMYMSNDAQKVSDIVAVWQAERGLISELNPQLFLEDYAQDSVGTLSGLDRADLEVFRSFAKDNRLVFASTPSDDPDKYIVIYHPKDSDLVKKTMDSTVWAFSGQEGRLLRDQMLVYLNNRQVVNRSLLETGKEVYIINSNSPDQYIHLTANDLTYFKNSKEIFNVSRNSSDFMDKGLRSLDGITRPILMTAEEYERFIKDSIVDKDALKKELEKRSEKLPSKDALKEAQEKQNERLENIQNKMALDDENTAGFWIYDDSVEFAESGKYENLEDIDTQSREDLIDAQKRAREYKFFQVENKSIDHLIAEAERRRSQAKKESKDKEHDFDFDK